MYSDSSEADGFVYYFLRAYYYLRKFIAVAAAQLGVRLMTV